VRTRKKQVLFIFWGAHPQAWPARCGCQLPASSMLVPIYLTGIADPGYNRSIGAIRVIG